MPHPTFPETEVSNRTALLRTQLPESSQNTGALSISRLTPLQGTTSRRPAPLVRSPPPTVIPPVRHLRAPPSSRLTPFQDATSRRPDTLARRPPDSQPTGQAPQGSAHLPALTTPGRHFETAGHTLARRPPGSQPTGQAPQGSAHLPALTTPGQHFETAGHPGPETSRQSSRLSGTSWLRPPRGYLLLTKRSVPLAVSD
jgi:hypothetical protein